MTQVVLIRPGATVYDEQNRVQGILDIPLSERGRAEAELEKLAPRGERIGALAAAALVLWGAALSLGILRFAP